MIGSRERSGSLVNNISLEPGTGIEYLDWGSRARLNWWGVGGTILVVREIGVLGLLRVGYYGALRLREPSEERDLFAENGTVGGDFSPNSPEPPMMTDLRRAPGLNPRFVRPSTNERSDFLT
jgi:hypothetical protein